MCDPEETILDCAENEDIDLPASCRAGACSECVAKVVQGTVDQEEQSVLTKEEVEQGYTLTCVAYPTSDIIMETHKSLED